jgi:N-dimethylarginine dimethylaminohydrolase
LHRSNGVNQTLPSTFRVTNRDGIAQLSDLLGSYDYQVQPVEVRGCLHLKSACSYVGRDTMLVNRSWIEAEPLRAFELIDVPDEEPAAANALLVKDVVIIPASFPKTRALLEERGFRDRAVGSRVAADRDELADPTGGRGSGIGLTSCKTSGPT